MNRTVWLWLLLTSDPPRQSSRARTKSRAASCSMLGIVTATISPRCSNRAKCRASRASVITRCRSLRIRRSSGRPGSSELFAGSCREGPSECVLHDCGDVAQLVADGPVAVVDRMVGVVRWAVKPASDQVRAHVVVGAAP